MAGSWEAPLGYGGLPCPSETAGPYSSLSVGWLSPLISLANKKPVSKEFRAMLLFYLNAQAATLTDEPGAGSSELPTPCCRTVADGRWSLCL